MTLISIVMPVYNEEHNIDRAYAAITSVLEPVEDIGIEFVFADNHSTDRTFEKLQDLAKRDARVRVLRYSRNFGFNRSLLTAYRHARGDAAIQIDCDLEDPPRVMLDFIRLWREGHDVVVGIRAKREENWLLVRARRLYYRLINAISEEVHEMDAGDFRLVDRSVLDRLCRVRDTQPYVRGLITRFTCNQGNVRYSRDKRVAGESKFGFRALFKLAFEGIFAQSTVPLQLASLIGFVIAIVTALISAVYLVLRLFSDSWPRGLATTTLLLLFGISINAIFLGIIGEYVGRIYTQVRGHPVVIVEETVNIETAEAMNRPKTGPS